MKSPFVPIVFLLLLFGNITIAQISHGGKPLSFSNHFAKSIAVFNTVPVDYRKLDDEDKNSLGRNKPFRFGKTHDVNLSPYNSGTWNISSNGEKIWQLRINSEKAYSIGLIFNKFKLSEGSRLFIYTSDKKRVMGSFTYKNNKDSEWFSTIPLPGDEIIVELNIPNNKEFGNLNISGIVHDYKNAFGLKTGYGDSEYCNVNINCQDGFDWQDEKRAIVRYLYGSSGFEYFCTAVLMNNTAYNSKPYLLTAGHCIGSQSTANTAVFMFNYESENCISTSEPNYQSISVSTLIATGGDLDFTLLELGENPPPSFNVYYAGWNRSANPAKNTVTIHHPQGDIKKISKDYDAPIFSDYGSGYVSNSHWNIGEWDLGTTEGGSSGAPLFDENHLIIGSLTGGDANCNYNYNDYYSRFDMNWDYYSRPKKQLKAWLDPTNTGTMSLNGFDPNSMVKGTDIAVVQINTPINTYCANNEIIPEIIIQNKGSINLTSALISYNLNNGSIVSKSWTGNLKPLETASFMFNPMTISPGNIVFKVFSSIPNGGKDINNYNDTLKSVFFGEELIDSLKIVGSSEICSQSLQETYSSNKQGKYLWQITGGTIEGKDTSHFISVNWNEWGNRSLNLKVTNFCNSVDAEEMNIDMVEQSILLEINTGIEGESVSWNLEDCNGNRLYQESNIEPNISYSKNICLRKGCYNFNLNSRNKGVTSYQLSNLLNNQQILGGNSVSGTVTGSFTLSASENLANFNVYPNPAKDELVIEGNFIELYSNCRFAIFKMDGSMVIPKNILDNRKTINISTLPKGMYIIEIVSDFGKFSKIFVKP